MWYKNKQKIDKQQKGEKITATWLNRCKPMYYVCRILRGLGRWEGRHFRCIVSVSAWTWLIHKESRVRCPAILLSSGPEGDSDMLRVGLH